MRTQFLVGALVMLLVCILGAYAWGELSSAMDAGMAKRGISDLRTASALLGRYNEDHGNYPKACEWELARQMLVAAGYTPSGGIREGTYYCSDGERYIIIYKPCGPEAPANGPCGPFAVVNGRWVLWPAYWDADSFKKLLGRSKDAS